MAGYKIVYNGGSAEIVEKKSRFIANVFPLGSEEEAAGILEGIKKKYGDANPFLQNHRIHRASHTNRKV